MMLLEVRGMWCYASGAAEELEALTTFLQVKDKGGDSLVDLFDSERERFLVGLLPRVEEWSGQPGNPKISEVYRPAPEPMPEGWSPPSLPPPPDLFPDITIRDYQLGAITAGIVGECGIIKVPTSGGKTLLAGGIAKLLGLPTLILVPTAPLVRQTIHSLEELGLVGIGQAGDGEFDPGNITVADVRYLRRLLSRGNRAARKLCDDARVVIVDECQGVGNDTTSSVVQATRARWRLGLSGTPFQKPDASTARDHILIGTLGPILFEVPAGELQRDGFIAAPRIYFVTVRTPGLYNYQIENNWPRARKGKVFNTIVEEGIVRHPTRNQLALDTAQIFVRRWGLSTLILVSRIEHGRVLLEELAIRGIRAVFVAGDRMVHLQNPEGGVETGEDDIMDHESQTVAAFARGEYEVLIGSPVFGVGYNLPGDMVQAMIPLCGGKGLIPVLQRLGRALRPKPGGNRVIILEFQDEHHFYLRNHSNARRKAYLSEGYEVLDHEGFIRDILRGIQPPSLAALPPVPDAAAEALAEARAITAQLLGGNYAK